MRCQKFYLSLIVCKAVPIEMLVNQIQKKIRKESVVAESKFQLGTLHCGSLTFASHKGGQRPRRGCDVAEPEPQVPAFLHEAQAPLPWRQL